MPKFICLALSLICCLVVQTLALAAGEKPEETTSESNAKLATTTLVGVPASDTSAQHQGRSRVKHNIFRRAIGKLTFSPVTAAFETIEGNSFGLVQPLKGMEEGLKELKLPLADVKQELGALSEPIDGLKSRIENLHSPLEEIKKSTGQLKEPLTAVNSNLDRLRQPIEQLQEPISQLNEPLADLKRPLNSLNTPLSELVGPIDGLSSPIDSLKHPIGGLSQEVNGLSSQVAQLSQEVKLLRRALGQLVCLIILAIALAAVGLATAGIFVFRAMAGRKKNKGS